MIYPREGNNPPKGGLIPHTLHRVKAVVERVPGNRLPLWEELASYQVVGGVTAYQMPKTGSWCESTTSQRGTETRPPLLREAAAGNLAQWAKA